jgi:hypothetical protein
MIFSFLALTRKLRFACPLFRKARARTSRHDVFIPFKPTNPSTSFHKNYVPQLICKFSAQKTYSDNLTIWRKISPSPLVAMAQITPTDNRGAHLVRMSALNYGTILN